MDFQLIMIYAADILDIHKYLTKKQYKIIFKFFKKCLLDY